MNMSVVFYVMAVAMILTFSVASPVDSSSKEPLHMERFRGSNNAVLAAGINPRAPMTCDRFPRVCRATGSTGPDCCRKSCVNVAVDPLNCGECGRRCRFGERCCGGRCLNVLYDAKNCGGCKKRCKKGSFCNYGMCSYA